MSEENPAWDVTVINQAHFQRLTVRSKAKRDERNRNLSSMMQQGQLLESQRGQKETSIFTHRVFYHEIVFDSASADLPAFFCCCCRHRRDRTM